MEFIIEPIGMSRTINVPPPPMSGIMDIPAISNTIVSLDSFPEKLKTPPLFRDKVHSQEMGFYISIFL